MFNKKLKFKVFVSHRSGAVAVLEGPKDITEHCWRVRKTSPNTCPLRLRYVGDVAIWFVCLQVSKEPADMALWNAVVRTRQFKTIPSFTPRYSHGSLGHSEQATKEVEKQIRATLFPMYADHNCNSDQFLAELQIFLGWFDKLRGRLHGMRSKLMVERHFST